MATNIFSAGAIAEAVKREVATTIPKDKSLAVVVAFDTRLDTPPLLQAGVAFRVGDEWQVVMKGGVELDDTPSPSLGIQILYTR